MPVQCPTCSKVNPSHAVYCYYDGRVLAQGSEQGPLGLGTLPFAMPFCFADGSSCANFNQLALACDERWNEAKNLLSEGIWQAFFNGNGRLDLAAAAKQAAKEPDADLGLAELLEKFPADPEALRPPKAALLSAEEDLGTLAPGEDRKFELQISNQGMLVLRGSVTTDCEWLCFGDNLGGPSLKLFQTRHTFSLKVRVPGNKLRAGRKPLEGQIVVETNGGCVTLPVRANIPIRPFPRGQYANDALADAKSPQELAVKAKAHPQEAAALFEQGAVKDWYASNGWTYPIQDTESKGKGAVQQFFEALGLTKPPVLEINTERIHCTGKVGQGLTKQVTISTKESRFVYARAWSNQDWIKVGPGKSLGNTMKMPLHIQVPPRPGETLHADVTIRGNGNQHFVVSVALAVVAADAEEKADPRSRVAGSVPGQLDSPPPAAAAYQKTMLAEETPPIHYNCPRCQKVLTAPPGEAGSKKPCPSCGQRLRIPGVSTAVAGQVNLNKTLLATEAANGPMAPMPAPRTAPIPRAANAGQGWQSLSPRALAAIGGGIVVLLLVVLVYRLAVPGASGTTQPDPVAMVEMERLKKELEQKEKESAQKNREAEIVRKALESQQAKMKEEVAAMLTQLKGDAKKAAELKNQQEADIKKNKQQEDELKAKLAALEKQAQEATAKPSVAVQPPSELAGTTWSGQLGFSHPEVGAIIIPMTLQFQDGGKVTAILTNPRDGKEQRGTQSYSQKGSTVTITGKPSEAVPTGVMELTITGNVLSGEIRIPIEGAAPVVARFTFTKK